MGQWVLAAMGTVAVVTVAVVSEAVSAPADEAELEQVVSASRGSKNGGHHWGEEE